MDVKFYLPDDVYLLIKEKDKVDFNTPFYQKNKEKYISLNIAKSLNIQPKEIFHYLKKLVGEKVEKDEVVAFKDSFFSHKKIKSPQKGQIKEINHHKGEIVLEVEDEEKIIVNSPFKGTVKKIEKDCVLFDLGKSISFPLKNKADLTFGGQVFYFQEEKNFTSDDLENKIVIAKEINSFFLVKMEALGASAFLTLKSLKEKEKNLLLKNIADMEKIISHQYSSCTVIKNSDMIYFYL